MVIQKRAKILLFLIVCTTCLRSQVNEIDNRLNSGELSMTFPSIYFKNNSTDYAKMPYTADSCLKYMAVNIKNLNSLNLWRDSAETDQLAYARIKKLRADLKRYTPSELNIRSMGKAQKISRRTIYTGTDSTQIQYLLSLNSVFDVSGAIKKKKKKYHCFMCFITGQRH
jgi:hypothetical protein